MPRALGRDGAEVVDRCDRYRVSSVVVDRVGAVFHLDGPESRLTARLCSATPTIATPVPVPAADLDLYRTAFEHVAGVSLGALLHRANARQQWLPPQALAVVLHDVAVAREAAVRALQAAEATAPSVEEFGVSRALEAASPRAVLVGFEGQVLHWPVVAAAFDPEYDGPDTPFAAFPRAPHLGPFISPEAVMGRRRDPIPEEVYLLGGLLATCLGGRVGGGNVWEHLQWVRLATPATLPARTPEPLRALVNRTMCSVELRLRTVAAFTASLRAAFDLADGRVALAASAASLFGPERADERRLAREGRHEEPTRPGDDRSARFALPGNRVEADARLVTLAALQAFLASRGEQPMALGAPAEPHGAPATLVDWRLAADFCASRGGRLPTELEWTLLSREPRCRELGRLWEWTADPAPDGGHIVRGGPWRDLGGPGQPDHRSFETSGTPDVGFRCVYDLSRGEAPGA